MWEEVGNVQERAYLGSYPFSCPDGTSLYLIFFLTSPGVLFPKKEPDDSKDEDEDDDEDDSSEEDSEDEEPPPKRRCECVGNGS